MGLKHSNILKICCPKLSNRIFIAAPMDIYSFYCKHCIRRSACMNWTRRLKSPKVHEKL